MSPRAICFVIMPYGKRPGRNRRIIDFDAVYRDVIEPAVDAVGFEPFRADEEANAGLLHRPMFERLLLSEYAVADVTLHNPNVYYELGVRHACRPQTTVLIAAEKSELAFDTQILHTQFYALSGGAPADPAAAKAALIESLTRAKTHDRPDSPLFELLVGFTPSRLEHSKTDVFREQVETSRKFRAALDAAGSDVGRLDAVRDGLGNVASTEAGAVTALYIAYRDAGAHERMLELYEAMDPVLRNTPLVQEQYAFGLNRLGRDREAERVLKELIERVGTSAERSGLLGRIYKDRWKKAKADGAGAAHWLREAIATYRAGFEVDWRDAYPGVNAVTLMAIADPGDPEVARLAEVVRYAVERKIAAKEEDYWDYATLVELAVIAGDFDEAKRQLDSALALFDRKGFPWNAQTTTDNFRAIAEAGRARGADMAALDEIIATLETRVRQ
jgi:tetratricopeptide (TPR) repeat protein